MRNAGDVDYVADGHALETVLVHGINHGIQDQRMCPFTLASATCTVAKKAPYIGRQLR